MTTVSAKMEGAEITDPTGGPIVVGFDGRFKSMSLLQWYAGQALPALIADAMAHNKTLLPGSDFFVEFDEIAGKAFAVGRAMIAAEEIVRHPFEGAPQPPRPEDFDGSQENALGRWIAGGSNVPLYDPPQSAEPKSQDVMCALLDEKNRVIDVLKAALQTFADFNKDPRRRVPVDLIITNGSPWAGKQLTMGDIYAAHDAIDKATADVFREVD